MAKHAPAVSEPPLRLAWPQALSWRLGRHYLLERAPRRALVDVVDRICGLHAQVMSSAELTAWARVDGLQADAVSKALWGDRSLVKLWAMRGTLHLLPARDLGVWLGAFGTYDHFLKPVWLRSFKTTPEELEGPIEATGEALAGTLLTREQLGMEIERITGSPGLKEKVQGSWGPFLKPASFRGRLCFGPNDGPRVRFTSPATWVEPSEEIAPADDALREVTRRYLGAFAPASREDLARWWGVSPAQGGRMLAALGDEIVPVDVEGTAAWILRAHAAEAAAAEDSKLARLLPGFDMWVIGASRDAAALLDPQHKKRVYRDQGWISPVLLVNGRMEGIWRFDRKGQRLLVTVEPFGRLARWARRQAEAEAERLAGFLGGTLEVTWAD